MTKHDNTSVTIATPKNCDICKQAGVEERAAVDGKTVFGPWANMCQLHFDLYGVGLGTGLGQRLVVQGEAES